MRPSPREARSRIVDLIADSAREALALRESLEAERQALEAQDTDALQAVVLSKNAHAENLHELDRQRSTLCQQWGFSAGPDQIDNVIGWCDEDDAISGCWAELMTIAAEGNALNLTNGAIIRLRQQHFETSLSVLRGVMPGSDTYGRNGEESGDFSRRSLAEA